MGEDVVDVFCNFLIRIEDFFSQVIETNKEMEITTEEDHSFQSALNCYYCGYELFDDKVHDHDHLTGEYRGEAHNKCNLLARKYKFVPVFFHNLSNYDAHLFIKTIAMKLKGHPNWKKREIKLLAKTAEEYISFQFGCLRFVDSLRFFLSKRFRSCYRINER
jgi:hypothetical protein